jgi:putative nucleotidyltransferase with HDIG domain
MLGFADDTVQAIRSLDEHWDGRGQAYNQKGEQIPPLARILGLSQTVEVFFSSHGVLTAYDIAERRSGTWFDPKLVEALRAIRKDSEFWRWLAHDDTTAGIAALEPADRIFEADDDRLDVVAEAFALVIDAKSPWTYQHSNGVAALTDGIAARLGVPAADRRDLRRAALLHDLGKLGVSSLILDKPGKLTDEEFAAIRRHPEHTSQILSRVGCFAHLADIASSHHERLDGRGYHRGRRQSDLTKQARMICVADICDALRQARPYRDGMSVDRVLEIMKRDAGTGLDPECLYALEAVLTTAEMPVNAPPARRVPALAEDYHQAA